MNTLEFLGNVGGRTLFVCGLLALAVAANAEWTVVRLDPPGSGGSQAFGVGGGQQVGNALLGSTRKAVIWSGSNGYVNLHPLQDGTSNATDTDGVFQVGNVRSRAALWQGTAASFRDLNPLGATESFATGLDGAVQVGRARFAGAVHAGLWTGTAASWVDLHPTSATSSFAYGAADGQQVGMVRTIEGERASVWTGSAQSWVDLNPQGASNSSALAVSQGRQIGSAFFDGVQHAGFWSGTAQSWQSLNQAGWGSATAQGAFENLIVGARGVEGQTHAGIWTGTADSWVDLHSFLPSLFSSSQATAVWKQGSRTYVVGHGNNNDNGEALLWISDAVPESEGVVVLGLGLGIFLLPFFRGKRP